MIKFILLLPLLFLLAACPGQLEVGPLDVSAALFEVDGQTSGLPGLPQVEADGCLFILRNAKLMKELEPDKSALMDNIYMETSGGCVFGREKRPETEPGPVLQPESNPNLRRSG